MATAQSTTDHDEIRTWVESRNGKPAVIEGTGMLRIDFGEREQNFEAVDWDRFFEIFDRSNVAFLYDPEGHMVKFVAKGSATASSNGRRKSSGRKKASSGRKKATGGRKKATGGRKKA
ncbi:MAG: hypothetical protein ABR508_12205, partial [Candidatus Baltobacteraceae bacterium]